MAYLGKTREPYFFYNADKATVELAKYLRSMPSPTEKLLWDRLRKNNIKGVKFRRQHPIGFYIADFYCHEAKLVIEVDGPIHSYVHQQEHDQNRTAEMERYGIKVIRFTNDEVNNHIQKVMQKIRKKITSCLKE